ncbi:NAD-dependent epimerase/dehydratase family protein [Alkalihalobacillus sp. LMS39]|uniref:NAD-dependent epimerase/dehydratase family protein n=1 Tax=Alkalihalobacillus sp. LMS39 TaxID=2924032 RepID=UPI001FB3339C|nr:NAD-dependent epimerase/dehydratase family protein [Alkalihalobacillus sp. LMS39]UOE93873.1 NAD-dependent epimerase/dehydratase family protein [Alkalihalobacillus sp. LMS39]
MKNILITGVNSYVGNSFEEWLQHYPNEYAIDKISLRDDTWKEVNFSKYDVILHVAGIAHVSTDPSMEELYYKVNRDLTIDVAKKAKEDGVKQFIFLSSIIVYGDSSKELRVIDENTVPNPSNFYGKSKLQAEEGIMSLQDENFNIVIVRPPMIYGINSKGNYRRLSKLAKKTPVFPSYNNQRSVIYIDNLCEFIRLLIINEDRGLFFPQNEVYMNTSNLVYIIGKLNGKKIRLTKVFNPLISILVKKSSIFNKVFGDLKYDMKVSKYKDAYIIKDFPNSIKEVENK